MAGSQDTSPSKSKKSVSFTNEQIVVDADGSVTMTTSIDETKATTAESHALPETATEAPANDAAVDLSLLKKKKKKKVVKEDDGEAPAGEEGGELTLKKKKKKKAPKESDDDDFAAKLKALELEGKDVDNAPAEEEVGDMDLGTGIWAHNETKPLSYNMLLERFFHQLSQKNPDHALSGSKSYKIPPPQCMREGNKKTIFANIAEICKRMKRTDEHVTAYLFAELGTSGSVDGSRRLVIKGRFQQKQLENVLRKYIIEYVTCKTCKSPDTELNKGENRLSFITCNSCGSRRSVAAIKIGFSAQIGRRKKTDG
ncbi:translation initiation factor eIF-2 beta subunit [Ceratocystis pirilliformis]|uniref:Translation initiation factor eIF-2 beta subunit n=1 Tax=Ceratocystis pirilliformis TaxID=259994 RepID=A0ABR3YZX9_9PEZI